LPRFRCVAITWHEQHRADFEWLLVFVDDGGDQRSRSIGDDNPEITDIGSRLDVEVPPCH
jgi:hypothetical protein